MICHIIYTAQVIGSKSYVVP